MLFLKLILDTGRSVSELLDRGYGAHSMSNIDFVQEMTFDRYLSITNLRSSHYLKIVPVIVVKAAACNQT